MNAPPKPLSPSRSLLTLALAAGILALFPLFVQRPMLIHVWIMILLAVSQGAAWNIVGGYAGQHSIGHAAYFGVGAYTTMMALEIWHISPLLGLGLAMLNALLLSVAIGSITFRLRGPYFVLASISVAEIIRLAALEFKEFTRGAEGILLTSTPVVSVGGVVVSFAAKTPYFYASLLLAFLVVAANWAVHNSKLGYYFRAIREDQDAAHSLGINLTLYKNIALGLSAILTACAGCLWAVYVKFIDPNLAFGVDVSVQMVLTAIIGGTGTIVGPVVGAFVLVLLSETLRNPKWLAAVDLIPHDSGFITFLQQHLSSSHVLFYGVLVVIVVLFAPNGIQGLIRQLLQRITLSEGASSSRTEAL